MNETTRMLHATIDVPVAVGVIGWAGIALLALAVVMWAIEEVRHWRAKQDRKPYRRQGSASMSRSRSHLLAAGFAQWLVSGLAMDSGMVWFGALGVLVGAVLVGIALELLE